MEQTSTGKVCSDLVGGDVRRHHSFEGTGYVRDYRDHASVFDPGRAKYAQCSDRGTVPDTVGSGDQRTVLKRRRSILSADHHLNVALWRSIASDAFSKDLDQA